MYKEQIHVTTNLMFVADGLVSIISAYAAYYLCWFIKPLGFMIEPNLFVSLVLALMFVNCFVMGQLGFYDTGFNPPPLKALQKILLAVASDFALITLGLFVIKEHSLSRLFLGLYGLLFVVGIFIVRSLFHLYFRKKTSDYSMRRILLLGDWRRVEAVRVAYARQKSWGHTVVGWLSIGEYAQYTTIPHLGTVADFVNIVVKKDIDEVVLAIPGGEEFDFPSCLDVCKKIGITCRIVPAMYTPGEERWGVQIESIDTVPALTIYGTTISVTGKFYKRLLDVVGGCVGFSLFLIMYLPIALAIRLESPGPILFSQTRVGQNNRHFNLYKFRSMFIDAEERKAELMAQNEMEGHMFKMKDDPRVTKVGAFLRKTSLDEFPQFINVIKGEMSLVGTRPPTVDEVAQYKQWERRRVSMKPGITGLWQVSGRNKIKNFEDVVRLDLEYIDGWRFLRDVKILLRTFWVIITKDGAS